MKDKEITKLGLDRFKVINGWRAKEEIADHLLAGISGRLGGQSMKSDTEISILKAVFYFLPYHICFTIDPYWKTEKKFHPVSAHIVMYKDIEIKGDPQKIIPYILYHLEENILHKYYLPIQKTIKKITVDVILMMKYLQLLFYRLKIKVKMMMNFIHMEFGLI